MFLIKFVKNRLNYSNNNNFLKYSIFNKIFNNRFLICLLRLYYVKHLLYIQSPQMIRQLKHILNIKHTNIQWMTKHKQMT